MTYPQLGCSPLGECIRECDLSLIVIVFVLLIAIYII